MNDGSMFSPFADFGDADTFNGHRTVYVFTPTANYQLTTFSIVHCAADDPLAQTTFASEQERQAYVQDKVDRSVVTVAGLPSAADMKHTFAFSTCDNLASERHALGAVRVRIRFDEHAASSDRRGCGQRWTPRPPRRRSDGAAKETVSMSTSVLPGARPDRLEEECAVFGVFAPGEDVARMTCFGLQALQHRGQESRRALPWAMVRRWWRRRIWAWSRRCSTKSTPGGARGLTWP